MERRQLGADGPEITVVGIGTAPIGSGREWVYWGGQDEREAVRGDPGRPRRGRELDRHGAVLRLGPGRGDRPPRARGTARRRPPLHQVRDRPRSRTGLADGQPAGGDPRRSRGEPAAARRRPRRPAPDPRSRPRHADRGVVGRAAAASGGRKDPLGRALEPPRGAGRARARGRAGDVVPGVAQPARGAEVPGRARDRPRATGSACSAGRRSPAASSSTAFRRTRSSRTTSAAPRRWRREARRSPRHARDATARGRTLRRHAVAWVLEQPGVTAAIIGVRNAHEGTELPALAAD